MTEAEEQGMSDRRPTPVRASMDATEPAVQSSGISDRTFREPEDGQEWVARVVGSSRGGVIPLRIVSLMEIVFSRVEDPHVPVRRNLCQGESLDALSEEELIRLLRDAGPVADPGARPPLQESRDRRKGARRKS